MVSVNIVLQKLRLVSKSVKVHTKVSLRLHPWTTFNSKKSLNSYETDGWSNKNGCSNSLGGVMGPLIKILQSPGNYFKITVD